VLAGEAAVPSSVDEYRRFHETRPSGISPDADNKIIDVNIVGAKMLGSAPQKLLGSKVTAFLAGQAETCYRSLTKNILDRSEWQECELEMKRADGSRFYALLQGRQITSTNEIVVFATDITGRKLTEDALKESERRYRELADLLAEGVFEADVGGTVTYANRRF
jgi:PAS domain S-box-containing protein